MEKEKDKRLRGVAFEQLVLDLLKAEAADIGKPLISAIEAGENYNIIDAVAPDGFLDLPGPCLIEIKLTTNIEALRHIFKRILDSRISANSILLILSEPQHFVERLSRHINNYIRDIPITIMGIDFVNELKTKYPDIAFRYEDSSLEEIIDYYTKPTSKKSSLQHLKALQSAFNNDRLVLFLGAGVSLGSGMPSWNVLLNNIVLRLIKEHSNIVLSAEHIDDIISYFKSEAPNSPIITARIIRDSLEDKFPDYVRSALYDNYSSDHSSPLIKEIGKLCVPRRTNRGLHAVVNYNFDECLEQELERRTIPYLAVISEDDIQSPNELPIYHPHGYLPYKKSISDKHRKSLVLSEGDYHDLYIDPFSWANMTQLNFLKNNVCLFVGLSMVDPNLRRLLEISQKKRPGLRHYVILKDHWAPSKKGSGILHIVANVFRSLEEKSFRELGVSVIWIKEYNQIPSILRRIRKNTR